MFLQKNNSFFSNKVFIKSICIFFFTRIIATTLIYFFLDKYDSRFFSFTDLEYYNNADLNIFSPNYFYGKLVQIIGYNSENIHSIFFLILSLSLSIAIVLPYISIASRVLKDNKAFIFSILLGSHPYIVLYSLKIDSSIFPLLAISIFNFYFFNQSNKNYLFLILTSSSCLIFRNSLLPFSILIYIYFFLKRNSFSNIQKSLIYISIVLVSFLFFSQFGYGVEFINQNFGCFSYLNISTFLGSFFSQDISNFLSILITPIVHFGLNLGAREAISVYCFNLPGEIASSHLINLSTTFIFFSYHLFLFLRLLYWILNNFLFSNILILVPFSILLPTLYGAAHMRYLLPILPMLLLWQFISKDITLNYVD